MRLKIAFLLLLSCCAYSAETSQDLARKLMQQDGSELHLKTLAEQIRDEIKGSKANMSEKAYDALSEAIDDEFEPDRLVESFAETLSHQAQKAELEQAIKWYGSSLGQKITAIARRDATPEGVKAANAYARQLEKNPPSASRLALARELDRKLSLTDLYVDLTTNVSGGMVAALQDPSPQHQALFMHQFRLKVAPSMKKSTFTNIVVSYRELTDDEFRQFIAFVSSPAGKNVFDATFLALDDALRGAAKKVGERMRAFAAGKQ